MQDGVVQARPGEKSHHLKNPVSEKAVVGLHLKRAEHFHLSLSVYLFNDSCAATPENTAVVRHAWCTLEEYISCFRPRSTPCKLCSKTDTDAEDPRSKPMLRAAEGYKKDTATAKYHLPIAVHTNKGS